MGAVEIVGLAGAVTLLVQGIKKLLELLWPAANTTVVGVTLNIAASLVATVATADPAQLYTFATIQQLLMVALGAGGLHSLVRR